MPPSIVMARLDRTIGPITPVRARMGMPMVRSSRTMMKKRKGAPPLAEVRTRLAA